MIRSIFHGLGTAVLIALGIMLFTVAFFVNAVRKIFGR